MKNFRTRVSGVSKNYQTFFELCQTENCSISRATCTSSAQSYLKILVILDTRRCCWEHFVCFAFQVFVPEAPKIDFLPVHHCFILIWRSTFDKKVLPDKLTSCHHFWILCWREDCFFWKESRELTAMCGTSPRECFHHAISTCSISQFLWQLEKSFVRKAWTLHLVYNLLDLKACGFEDGLSQTTQTTTDVPATEQPLLSTKKFVC